ncbi:MAG: F0F1 ATP synthase subunit B [Chloroflexi bacterium]|jgi:F-type H+-transporting ATPase subunit b|nr:F0F1 ATP synthase subunit B [Chloroflexota bacterium]
MEGLAALGFNLPVLVAQVVNVIVLFVILYLVAYKPMMRMLDERSRRIKESLAQADSVREQAAQAETEVKKQLEAASRDGQEKIARAVQIGEEVKQKAQLEARQEAEALITRARSEIHRERDEAIDEVRKEVADLTILAAEKVIDQSLDKKAHRRLIDKVLAESEALKRE